MGIFILFLEHKGFTSLQIGALQALLFWTMFVFQIPSGVFGDRFGRKYTVLIGTIFMLIGTISHIIFQSFSSFIIIHILFILENKKENCVYQFERLGYYKFDHFDEDSVAVFIKIIELVDTYNKINN